MPRRARFLAGAGRVAGWAAFAPALAITAAALWFAAPQLAGRRQPIPAARYPVWRCYDSLDLAQDRQTGEQESLDDEDEIRCRRVVTPRSSR